MEGNRMEEGVERDMTPRLVGETYMKYPTEKSIKKYRYGLYECQYCKKEFEAQTAHIKSGGTKSCGCLREDIHGLTYNRFYKTWYGMLQRCNNPKIKAYKNYGGRGITVCEDWLDVRNFVDWAEKTYPNIEGHTLDRIDNDKGYSPENCRWADKTTQNINQRMREDNKSGYIGVRWREDRNKWVVCVRTGVKNAYIGQFEDLMEAVIFRDNYILENKLPNKLNLKQEQINE